MLFRQPRDPQDMKLLNVAWVQMPPEGLGVKDMLESIWLHLLVKIVALGSPYSFRQVRGHTQGVLRKWAALYLASLVVVMSFLSGNLGIKSAEYKQKCGLTSWPLLVLCLYFLEHRD